MQRFCALTICYIPTHNCPTYFFVNPKLRITNKNPWHSPPHIQGNKMYFHIIAACYEHRHIIGYSNLRMSLFEIMLCEYVEKSVEKIYAWAVLPYHYHILVKTDNVFATLKQLGKLHGKSSYLWNGEENKRGRRVWCNSAEHGIKSNRHFLATINYIYNNPVKHGYVKKWNEWPFSSFHLYLESVGRDEAERIWREYDISEMGNDWDIY